MRNKYPGVCYKCGEKVEVGAGHFERSGGGWKTIHVNCVFKQRDEKQARQDKINERWAIIDGSRTKGEEIKR